MENRLNQQTDRDLRLTVTKNEHGQFCLRANTLIAKDDVVLDLTTGTITTVRELRTIDIGSGLHSDHPLGGYTNHSCEPTCYVDKQDKTLKALRDIYPGDEINFDYMVSEDDISSSFNCSCGSVRCRGFIGTKNSKPSYLE